MVANHDRMRLPVGFSTGSLYRAGIPIRTRIRPGSLATASPPTSSMNPRSFTAASRSGSIASNLSVKRNESDGDGTAGSAARVHSTISSLTGRFGGTCPAGAAAAQTSVPIALP